MHASDIECRLTQTAVEQILDDERVLATVAHDGGACRPTGNARHLTSGLTWLGGAGANELWRLHGAALQYGIEDGCYWAQSDGVLFAALWLEDAEGEALADSIRHGYERLMAFARSRGAPHLIRVWNYLNDINRGENDAERYKLFCRGRHQALADAGYDANAYPAASALGHNAGGNIIYLIAGSLPCRHFENPRQVSAYRYPREYGPQSPSFARATVQPGTGNGGLIYLSGTASILGYRTQHPDDLDGQLDVTLNNLDALTGSIADTLHKDTPPEPAVLKVYLRREHDLDRVRRRIESHYRHAPDVAYLRADICRRELLVEVEGVCGL